jgi:hypothetical protein
MDGTGTPIVYIDSIASTGMGRVAWVVVNIADIVSADIEIASSTGMTVGDPWRSFSVGAVP